MKKKNESKKSPEDFKELAAELPANYALMEESTAKAFLVPIESTFHNDRMYHSYSFYRPISKIKKPT